MKKLCEEIRRQNTPALSLDKEILERAKTLRAGNKVILSEQRKERNGMNITMNKSENAAPTAVKRSYGGIVAAAAAIVFAAVKLISLAKKKADQWADDVQMGRGLK